MVVVRLHHVPRNSSRGPRASGHAPWSPAFAAKRGHQCRQLRGAPVAAEDQRVQAPGAGPSRDAETRGHGPMTRLGAKKARGEAPRKPKRGFVGLRYVDPQTGKELRAAAVHAPAFRAAFAGPAGDMFRPERLARLATSGLFRDPDEVLRIVALMRKNAVAVDVPVRVEAEP